MRNIFEILNKSMWYVHVSLILFCIASCLQAQQDLQDLPEDQREQAKERLKRMRERAKNMKARPGIKLPELPKKLEWKIKFRRRTIYDLFICSFDQFFSNNPLLIIQTTPHKLSGMSRYNPHEIKKLKSRNKWHDIEGKYDKEMKGTWNILDNVNQKEIRTEKRKYHFFVEPVYGPHKRRKPILRRLRQTNPFDHGLYNRYPKKKPVLLCNFIADGKEQNPFNVRIIAHRKHLDPLKKAVQFVLDNKELFTSSVTKNRKKKLLGIFDNKDNPFLRIFAFKKLIQNDRVNKQKVKEMVKAQEGFALEACLFMMASVYSRNNQNHIKEIINSLITDEKSTDHILSILRCLAFYFTRSHTFRLRRPDNLFISKKALEIYHILKERGVVKSDPEVKFIYERMGPEDLRAEIRDEKRKRRELRELEKKLRKKYEESQKSLENSQEKPEEEQK